VLGGESGVETHALGVAGVASGGVVAGGRAAAAHGGVARGAAAAAAAISAARPGEKSARFITCRE
jgi:hypothetical protein